MYKRQALEGVDLSSLKTNQIYLAPQDNATVPVAVLKTRSSYIMITSHTDRNELVSFQNSALIALLLSLIHILLRQRVTNLLTKAKR